MTPLGVAVGGSRQVVEAATHALREGGNAADAAVAGAIATSSGEPSLTSLAGGAIVLHRDGFTGAVTVLNGFATAPGLDGRRGPRPADPAEGLPPLEFVPIELDFLVGGAKQTFHVGRGAAAVPGTLPALFEAQKRWGRLDPRTVLQPAIAQLEGGVVLNAYQTQCKRVLSPILRRSSLGRKRFFLSGGSVLSPGDVFRCPELARTLRDIGDRGVGAVGGEIADRVAGAFGEAAGGLITPADLAAWRSGIGPGLAGAYRGAAVYGCPAPAVGGRFIAHTLALMERFDLAGAPDEGARLWRLTAILRAVSELRGEIEDLLDREEAAALLESRVETILGGGEAPDGRPEPRVPGNTTHIGVIDAEGNAAGITLSYGEGNGYEIPETGLLMNNFLGEADLFPRGFHRYTPGERLPTMMSPTIVVEPDGAVSVIGAGGANRIRTAIPQVVSALVDRGDRSEGAVTRGRIHVEEGVLSAEVYAIEGGQASLDRARSLVREVKPIRERSLFFGGVHVARRRADGTFGGFGDPRRDGTVEVVE